MRWLNKINQNRAAPGLEQTLWRLVPKALSISVLVPAAVAFIARLLIAGGPEASKRIATIDITAIAVVITAVTAVLTVAIGCIVVFIMKGPGYVADAYEINDRDKPSPEGEPDER